MMPEAGETVVIVDDDPSIREALLALMESIGMHALAHGSVQEFLDAPAVEGPQCIVLDVRMPGRSGLDLQADLARRNPPPPIIFLTGHADVPMSVRAMKAGAIEFLMKPFRDQDLIDAIHEGIERDRRQQTDRVTLDSLRERYESLTPRAKEVLQYVAQGLLNKQIAGKLDVSEITVKVHRGQAMRKMGAKSLADLVRMADLLGIVPASR